MVTLNIYNYLEREKSSKKIRNDNTIWPVRPNANGSSGILQFSTIKIPKKYIGRKVRVKIELIERIKQE